MKTGLFFGSFNPMHTGHLAIAQYILNETEIEKIMFIVSPQNPFKEKSALLDADLRLEMAKLSVKDNDKMEVSDVEFHLPQPNFTYLTLEKLREMFPEENFSMIMGSDTLEQLNGWKNPAEILKYQLIVYKRSEKFMNPFPGNTNIRILEAPVLPISASMIRKMLEEKKEIKYLVKDEIINNLKKEYQ